MPRRLTAELLPAPGPLRSPEGLAARPDRGPSLPAVDRASTGVGIRGPAPGAARPSRPARLGPPECTARAPRGPPSRAPWPRRERLPGSARRQRGRPRDAPWTHSSVQEATASCRVDPRGVNADAVSRNSRVYGLSRASGSSWLCVLLGAQLCWLTSIRLPRGALRRSVLCPPSYWGIPTPKRSCGFCLYSHSVGISACQLSNSCRFPVDGRTHWRSPWGQAQGRAGAVRTGQKGHVLQWVLEARCSRAGRREQLGQVGAHTAHCWFFSGSQRGQLGVR